MLRNRLSFIAVEHCRESIRTLVFTASGYLSLVCDPRHASDNSVGKNGASSRERGHGEHHASNGSRRLRGDTLHHVVRSDLCLFRSGGPAPQRTTRGRIVLLHRALDALGRFPAIREQALARVAVRARPIRYSPLVRDHPLTRRRWFPSLRHPAVDLSRGRPRHAIGRPRLDGSNRSSAGRSMRRRLSRLKRLLELHFLEKEIRHQPPQP